MLVGVVFIFLFGSLALKSIPYQLIPQVSRPIVSVYTSWSNANVYEIEAEVIVPQEKALKSLAGLQVMTSIAREGRGSINLEFEEGSNLDTILLDISQKLGEIRSYPEGVNRPIIKGSGESVPPSIYLFLHSLNPDRSIEDERVFFVNEIAPFLERIKGVGEVSVLGGRDEQMQILLDTKLLAYNNITINEVIVAISKANKNTSAGILDYSSRAYRIRVDSKFSSIDDIYNVVIKSERGRNILLRDLADVKEGFAKSQVYSFHNNEDAISVRIHPSVNTNVLELTEAVRKEVTRLNENILKPQGLSLEWSRDQEGYILEAIDLVKENLLYGILFSCLVLLIFLRQMSSVLIVTFVILLSTFGTFIVLYIFNRTLNIVSLAGISFAISMLVDNAIVVLENIHQHRLKAKSLFQSALDGTYEVAGAIFASVLTTVAIFIPILGLKSESGQLFFDIALASTSALLISLFISLFIIPMLVCEFEKLSLLRWDIKKFWDFIFTPLEYGGRGFYFVMHKALNFFLKNWLRRLLCIFGFSAMSVYLYFVLMPKISYLPHGDQNFAIAYLSIPPGLSYQERKGIAKEIYEKNKHYLSINGYKGEKQGIAAIKDLFFIGSDSFMMIGAIAEDKSKIEMMSKKLQQDISSIPSVRGSVFQQGIFDGGNGGLSVDLYINGHNLDTLRANAEEIIEKIKEKIPKANVRAVPTLEINNKEIAFYPDLQALALNGLDAKSFGEVISTILSGKVIGEFQTPSGRNIDLILKSNNYNQIAPEDLSYAQIYTPQGNIVSLYSLAQIKEQYGLTQIRHYERERSYLLIILPPKDMDLESVIKIIKKEILPTVDLGENKVLLKGSANELEKTSLDLLGGFALAVVITYLLLCALYGNFIYPFVIIFTLPFAVVGGFIGLKLTNLFIAPQPLDVLGMLGMIILVGSVVNNAILIVYQSLINIRNYGLRPYEAVLNATLSRMRPIYMSMLTSVCGLLPLVIFSGSGSEIYRGLGAVIIGGLVFSTLISLFVIPSLLLFFIQREKAQKGGEE